MPRPLAPLQRVMLEDTLFRGGENPHVEQVEIVFAPDLEMDRVIPAWNATVANTDVLRMAFSFDQEMNPSWDFAENHGSLTLESGALGESSDWLRQDRLLPLLTESSAPWRASFWPDERRWIWTFHHAILDGRSISAILRSFLTRLAGQESATLPLSEWSPATDHDLENATRIFQETFDGLVAASIPPLPTEGDVSRASRRLGPEMLRRAHSFAEQTFTTVPTLLTWAWGQALAETADADAVVIEQVRAGAPQNGTAGFLMNVLPIMVQRSAGRMEIDDLKNFRSRLVRLREIETISPAEIPPGILPPLTGPWNSVIMIENGSLAHMIGSKVVDQITGSLLLHESTTCGLTASAYLQPDLLLEVEGLGRHGLLKAWTARFEETLSLTHASHRLE